MQFSAAAMLTASALLLSLAAGTASAQPASSPPAAAPPQAGVATPQTAHPHMSLNDRFTAANTSNDGRLTLDQARAGMPMVARHFAAMDKDNKGYVTLADVHEYLKEQRAARKQVQPNSNG